MGRGARLRLTCTRHVSRAPVTTEAPWTLLRALSPSLSSPASRAAPQVAYAQLEELSTLLRLHLRHGLQEEALWLLDGFEQLSGEVSTWYVVRAALRRGEYVVCSSSSSPAR